MNARISTISQILLLCLSITAFSFCNLFAQSSESLPPNPWKPDLGNGKYKNPVLFADYSDPDVVRSGDDYYLTASSFNCSPGLPILHSRDLVNWKIVNYALPKLYDKAFEKPQHGNGVWAPSFRFHDGWYYIYWGDPDRGIYMVRAKDPLDEWEKPVLVKKAYGNIDPCPLWDDDGKVYMVQAFAHSRAGVNSLLSVVELTSDGKDILDKGWIVFDGHEEHETVEGPKFFKRNGYYYIFAPAGGVAQGWQLVLRSKNVRGPYEVKKVLAQGPTEINGPHQGAWVETPEGEHWFMHFQESQPYGRIVHLQPVRWENDWPVMGEDPDGDGVGQPVLEYRKPQSNPVEICEPATSDNFSNPKLGLQWQWHADPTSEWHSLSARNSWLRLRAVSQSSDFKNLWDTPNLLLQKLPAPEFTATCRIDASKLEEGETAGLLMMGMNYSYVGAQKKGGKLQIVKRSCFNAERGTKEIEEAQETPNSNIVWLQINFAQGGACTFAYKEDPKPWQPLGKSFRAREGKWIGAKVGLFCNGSKEAKEPGYVDIDWFKIQ